MSGKTKEFLFSPNESAGDIAQHVFDNWPEGKYDKGISRQHDFVIRFEITFSAFIQEFHYSIFFISFLYINLLFAD